MSINASFIFPHPPLIIPQVGKGEQHKIQKTIDAYEKASKMIADLKPDTIVLCSSHCTMYYDYIFVAPGGKYMSDLSRFGAYEPVVQADYDDEFINELDEQFSKSAISAGTKGRDNAPADHASMIPLYFVNKYYNSYKLVRIGISGLSFDTHFDVGKMISKVSDSLSRNTVFIASGDLSHKLKATGPYGYAKEGEQFDDKIVEIIQKGDVFEFSDFSEDFLEKAAECGLRTFIIMAGAIHDKGFKSELLSYERTFGVGYAVASYTKPQE